MSSFYYVVPAETAAAKVHQKSDQPGGRWPRQANMPHLSDFMLMLVLRATHPPPDPVLRPNISVGKKGAESIIYVHPLRMAEVRQQKWTWLSSAVL